MLITGASPRSDRSGESMCQASCGITARSPALIWRGSLFRVCSQASPCPMK